MALCRRTRSYKVIGGLILVILVLKLALHEEAEIIKPEEEPRGFPGLGLDPKIEADSRHDAGGIPEEDDAGLGQVAGHEGVKPIDHPLPDDNDGGIKDNYDAYGYKIERHLPRDALVAPPEVKVTAAPVMVPVPEHIPHPPTTAPPAGKQQVEGSVNLTHHTVPPSHRSPGNNTAVIPQVIERGGENGQLGAPVVVNASLLTPEEKAKYDKGWKNYQFNEYVSNMIPLHRQLPKVKLVGCSNRTIPPQNLPDTSVIIVFHNEAWSVLLRTLYSVLDTSPPDLLKEVIFVDDASDLPHLKGPLEAYLAGVPKARLLRAPTWGGLIQARLLGARHAQGTTLTFLDSHCECFPGWLEPLLERIALSPTTVVCPYIEAINDTDFRVGESGLWSMGGFDWDLIFQWKNPGKQRLALRKGPWDVLTSPTMAGGLFSIDKKFFERLGGYDPEFGFWGGENMEISFKIWMCGGRLELLPCSLVGHVFRRHSPHTGGGATWKQITRNTARVAEVWLDQYKYVYYRNNDDNKAPEFGNVSSRLAIRESLQCKSFDWYLRNVYPEKTIPRLYGSFQNQGIDRCLDSHASRGSDVKTIIGYPCNKGNPQRFMWTEQDEFLRFDKCLDHNNGNISMLGCHEMKGQQQWILGKDQTIRLGYNRECLTLKPDDSTLTVVPCDLTNPRHLWQGPAPLQGFSDPILS